MIIRQKDKENIISLALKTIKTPCKLLAFGSRVSGEAHDTSDLDMVIVAENQKKLNIEEFVNFKETLQNSNIPILIQLFDWYRLPENFHKNILENCEEIMGIS